MSMSIPNTKFIIPNNKYKYPAYQIYHQKYHIPHPKIQNLASQVLIKVFIECSQMCSTEGDKATSMSYSRSHIYVKYQIHYPKYKIQHFK